MRSAFRINRGFCARIGRPFRRPILLLRMGASSPIYPERYTQKGCKNSYEPERGTRNGERGTENDALKITTTACSSADS